MNEYGKCYLAGQSLSFLCSKCKRDQNSSSQYYNYHLVFKVTFLKIKNSTSTDIHNCHFYQNSN